MRGTTRRAFIVAGSLAAVAVPLAPVLTACTTEPPPPPPPDPLAHLAAEARADATAADAIASSVPELATTATLVAKARSEHALVLQREVDRERPPKTSASGASGSVPATSPAPTPPDPTAAETSLVEALKSAEQNAAKLVAAVPRYRAGLLGSVAAGCAGLREVFT